MRLYLVGGAVRDRLLKINSSADRDWVVVGSTPEEMLGLGFKPVGRGFPVFIKPGHNGEYALARSERKIASGYRGFSFNASPNVSLEDDLRRRDLTINAIAYNEEKGRYIDPWGGARDIEKRALRHVSEAFVEDPVRVLRVARFAARFAALGFKIHDSTRTLMRQMARAGETAALVPERVWKETESALKGENPAVFFESLRDAEALSVLSPDFVVFSKSQCYQPALAALENSRDLSALERFLLLALYAADCSLSLCEVCRVLKMPSSYHKGAKNIFRFYSLLQKNTSLDANTLLAIVECFDSIRNAERLPQLNRILDNFVPAESHPFLLRRPWRLKQTIAEAGAALRSLDLKTLLRHETASSKAETVRKARLKSLSSLIAKVGRKNSDD